MDGDTVSGHEKKYEWCGKRARWNGSLSTWLVCGRMAGHGGKCIDFTRSMSVGFDPPSASPAVTHTGPQE